MDDVSKGTHQETETNVVSGGFLGGAQGKPSDFGAPGSISTGPGAVYRMWVLRFGAPATWRGAAPRPAPRRRWRAPKARSGGNRRPGGGVEG